MADTPNQDRKLGLPRTKIGKKFVTEYQPDLALHIVEQIAEGKLLKDICTSENGMPHVTTFLKWVARVPELAQAYSAAKEISALMFEEEAIDIARASFKSPGTAQKVTAANALINQLRWSAGRRDPKSYGDKAGAQITVPIQINTTLDMGSNSVQQVDMPDIYTIEVEAVEVPKPVYEKKKGGGQPGPKKRVLTPLIGMDEQTKLKERTKGGRVS